MKNNSTPTVCLLLVILTGTCKKSGLPDPYNTLPPITQQGKGTFGCLVNGNVWVPHFPCSLEPSGGGCDAMQFAIWPDDNNRLPNSPLPIGFNLSAGRIENDTTTKFEISSYYTNGRSLITSPGSYADLFDFDCIKASGTEFLVYRTTAGGRFRNVNFNVTKIDTVKGFISGLFNFTLYLDNSANTPVDSMVVADGRFDLPFTQDTCTCSPN